MNELFTILIILAAIISFINKILSEKKRLPSTGRPTRPEPEPTEWGFPWSEDELELESAPAIEEKETQSAIEKQIFAFPSVPRKSEKADKPAVPDFPVRATKPIPAERNLIPGKPIPSKTDVLGIRLSSSEGLKQGIILAEILGPCKAKRNVRKF